MPATGMGPRHGNIVAKEAFERLGALVDGLGFVTAADDALEAILVEGTSGIGAQSAAVFRVDHAEGMLAIQRQRNLSPGALAAFPLALDVVIPATEAVRSGAAIWIDDRVQRDRWFPLLEGSEIAVHSSALLPLHHHGRVIGVLGLGFDGDHRFAETERQYCGILAGLAALVLALALQP